MLRFLGAEEDDQYIKFKKDDPILKMFPRRLEDDGMGYGINPEWVIEVNTDRTQYFNIFTAPELSKEELDEYVKTYLGGNKKIMDEASNK